MQIINIKENRYKVVGIIPESKIKEEEVQKFRLLFNSDLAAKKNNLYYFLDEITDAEFINLEEKIIKEDKLEEVTNTK